MRVYNPRATFEQAEQISKLFEEADQSKKKKKKKSKNTETPHDEEAMSLADLPTDVLLKIFIHVADPHNYTEEARTSNRRYSATKVAALRLKTETYADSVLHRYEKPYCSSGSRYAIWLRVAPLDRGRSMRVNHCETLEQRAVYYGKSREKTNGSLNEKRNAHEDHSAAFDVTRYANDNSVSTPAKQPSSSCNVRQISVCRSTHTTTRQITDKYPEEVLRRGLQNDSYLKGRVP
ncbi:unnamed protein product [Heligmosomoides polygyrus]|uniref:F-box domain-containing protein n=1 Tax=Heligmosomoides polygyrus TaxID=6339 RepID=A0A183G9U6_HELPZ|nr:unnamed protein product [Heligmosomoides polygyrus]